MTDIVERLRKLNAVVTFDSPALLEAADEIERLEAELRSEREGKISQSYAAELARQVGELEAENEQLHLLLDKPGASAGKSE